MSHNKVVVFSNGIADLQRSFVVKRGQPTEISIPVRKDHVADVLASLNIYGDVTVAKPASFRPANDTAGTLSINAERVFEDLAKKLSGSKVTIDKAGGTLEGVLVGLHVEPEGKGDDKSFPKSIVVLTDQGLAKTSIKEVQKLRFCDAAVQAEIDKALQRNFQQIKPDSTFVDLTVTTEQEQSEVTLQYTVPAAAWKISYRLRSMDDKCEFQGFAIVDNNTDEDWQDALISVVTGDPITFSTDLAEAKIPLRRRVNVVTDAALGAVEVEEAVMMMMAAPAAGGAAAVAFAQESPEEPTRGSRMAKRRHMSMAAPTAKIETAETREIGDFCVFDSPQPVSIGSHRSAVIPVFLTALGQAKTILHYKRENHAERAYRAIRFVNETTHNLGRGVCTVYEDGTYGGSCILPATPPGGDCLLPHALEGGVKFREEVKRRQSKAVRFRLSEGFGYTSFHEKQVTAYHFKNSKVESFELVLDHQLRLDEPEIEVTLISVGGAKQVLSVKERLESGIRVQLTIAPQMAGEVLITESRVNESRIAIVDVNGQKDHMNLHWLEENLMAANGPLAHDPAMHKCLEMQRALDAKRAQISDAVAETDRLAARQERLRKNLAAGGHDDQSVQWRTSLGDAENRISELDEKIVPQLKQEERAIKEELRALMLSLSADWQTAK